MASREGALGPGFGGRRGQTGGAQAGGQEAVDDEVVAMGAPVDFEVQSEDGGGQADEFQEESASQPRQPRLQQSRAC